MWSLPLDLACIKLKLKFFSFLRVLLLREYKFSWSLSTCSFPHIDLRMIVIYENVLETKFNMVKSKSAFQNFTLKGFFFNEFKKLQKMSLKKSSNNIFPPKKKGSNKRTQASCFPK